MSDTPATPESWTELEELLLACLERPEHQQTAALEELCVQHPRHAGALRQRFAVLTELGFVGASLPPPLQAGEQFGDYRLVRRLGGGAMGVVYLAEQQSTQRPVALKVLRPELLDQPRAHERFRRELAAAARLAHPGICPVYDAGTVAGRPYIAMRYLPGESLAEAIERTRRSGMASSSVILPAAAASGERERVEAAVVLVEQAARAVHAAHQHGLVHRDVKPANILVAEDGAPVLVDFGLAHDDVAASLTLSTDRLGTPAYMAPEQIEPHGRPADARTDVHALGAVLFECLSLHAPYEASNREALYRLILTADPPDARKWNSTVSSDLAVVVQKALEKEPARRYASALELAEDLRRVREHEPVQARPAGAWLRLRRWSQRNPLLAGALLAVFVCLGAGLSVTLTLLLRVQRELASRQAGDIAALSALALDHDTRLAMQHALEAWQLDPENPTTVSALYAAAGQLREQGCRSLESPYCISGPADGSWFVVGSDQSQETWLFRPGDEPVKLATRGAGHKLLNRVIAAADGSRILALSVADGRSETEPPGGLATVWEPSRPRRPLARLPHPGEVLTGCFTADGRVLTGCADGIARLWSGEQSHELRGHQGPVSACAASPDGQVLVTGSHDCTIRLWHAGSGEPCSEPIQHGGRVVAIDFAPARPGRLDRFVTATGHDSLRGWYDDPGFADDSARVFDRTGHLIASLAPCDSRLVGARFSPDGRHVLTFGSGQKARLWLVDDDGTVRLVETLKQDGVVHDGCFDATGERLATITFSGTAYLWDRAGNCLAELRGHGACGYGCRFQGNSLVTTALDGTVRTWSTESLLAPSWAHGLVTKASYSEQDRKIVVAEQRGIVHSWDPRGSGTAAHFDSRIRNVRGLAVSSDGRRVVLGSEDGRLHLFGADGVSLQEPVQAHPRRIQQVMFSPTDPDLLLSAGYEGVLVLWNLRQPTATPAAELIPFPWSPGQGPRPLVTGHPSHALWAAAFSPDGCWIATATDDPGCTLALWNVDDCRHGTRDRAVVLGTNKGPLRSLAFARSSPFLACATLHGSVWLWDLVTRTGSMIRQLERDVTSIALSPDGNTVACGLMEGSVRVLRADGSLRYVLPRPLEDGRIKSLEFTADGTRLMVATEPGRITEWPVDPHRLVTLARELLAKAGAGDQQPRRGAMRNR